MSYALRSPCWPRLVICISISISIGMVLCYGVEAYEIELGIA